MRARPPHNQMAADFFAEHISCTSGNELIPLSAACSEAFLASKALPISPKIPTLFASKNLKSESGSGGAICQLITLAMMRSSSAAGRRAQRQRCIAGAMV
ncbi:hypothetical protein HUU05_13915 [candidate division KSB1 bacterium]|nr:hypothetical protein [candidate division KSB1 bacterium]